MAHHGHPGYGGPGMPRVNVPPGTFPPGTMITVGAHKCTIERYLSEGGFAHVYLVKLSQPANGTDVAVLKRVAVPDKEALASMRTEVETMKRLRGHRHIVTYIDSHASHLQGGGYEVFLLMEYCSGGGLIDFMNTRLQHRLTEPEILRIFDHVSEGVACMHYLQPPLLHRDLKVENVLIAPNGTYKLCDFGSCSTVKPAPQTIQECRLVEEDIQKHTTLQYRSPEMVDVGRRLPIDEKSDIWALGVLLYKLCYYTTPFEDKGQMAIMSATYTFPQYPHFSDRLRNLIASMLREQPHKRPNIYQVVREVCYMRGKECPIKDIYSAQAAARSPAEKIMPALPVQSPPSVVAYEAPRQQAPPPLPDITPMRRGRPTKPTTAQPAVHSASPSQTRAEHRSSPQIRPTTADPFAALDSKIVPPPQDDLSARFPSVEQFSLLHDSGGKFQFSPSGHSPVDPIDEARIAKLAEDAFASPSPDPSLRSPPPQTGVQTHRAVQAVQQALTGNKNPVPQPTYSTPPPRPKMVSTGTMTSPPPDESTKRLSEIAVQTYGLTPTTSHTESQTAATYRAGAQLPHRPHLLDSAGRSSSYSAATARSTRPSMETTRPDLSAAAVPDPMVRSKSAMSSRPRPHSVYVESNLEYLRDLESPSTQGPPTGGLPDLASLKMTHTGNSMSSHHSNEAHIESDVGYLRAMEAEEPHKSEKRMSGSFAKHVKRASMPSISLPKGGKNKLQGKFGDAFKRFERGGGHDAPRTPSSEQEPELSPVEGSTATGDVGDDWEVNTQDISPEVRRELEMRQLAAEERRVEQAREEYKRQLANSQGAAARPSGTRNRANSIQRRVHTLLNENQSKPPPRTAAGYGRYTDAPPQDIPAYQGDSYRIQSSTRPGAPANAAQTVTATTTTTASMKIARKPVGSSAAAPPPPPKPTKLRTGGSTAAPVTRSPSKQGDLIDLSQTEDWERDFAKRYPGVEMVETVVASTGRK